MMAAGSVKTEITAADINHRLNYILSKNRLIWIQIKKTNNNQKGESYHETDELFILTQKPILFVIKFFNKIWFYSSWENK